MKDTAVQTLITLLDNLSSTVAGLELLNPAHRSRFLARLQTIPEVKPTTVHELVELVAHSYPSNPAICTSTLTLTYGRLDALSSQLAQHLAFLGATPGTPVAFCLDRSPWAVVTIYAILKAGGACLPLSPDDSLSQHRTILGWTRATILVTDKKYASQFEELEGIVVLTDCDDINASGMHSQIEHLRRTVPTRANPGSAAFMSFQSEPQSPSSGVVFDHASISTSIEYAKVAGVLDGCDRSLHLFPYTSIVSIAEVFTALAMAATVCIPSDDEKAQHLSSFVKRQNVKFAHLTPMLACQLDPSDTALCTVAFGGERVPHGLLRAWTNCTNVLEYHEYMCPTTYSRLQDGTIGKPIGTLTWIADCKDPNKLAPVGCPGELLIESPIMPRSYFDQGQAGKSFLVDPAWTTSMPVPGVTGSRILLRTGQLARQNPDGTLVVLGRHDSRVQIQGHNINMDEINAKLSDQLDSSVATLVPTQGHWCEKLVVVFSPARQPAPMGKELEIWVTDDSATKIEEMSRALQDQDHFHTLPLVWIPVVGLPITPYGKLDREKVKSWVHELDEESCERIGSIGQAQIQEVIRSEVERELVSVWSEVLGIPEAMVATDQSFFRLGGDSMAAMHAAREMQSRGLPIAVHDILRLRTITALAELVKVAGHNMRAPEVALNRVPDSIDTPFPLTPIQVMHFQAYSDGLDHFNQSCFLRCRRWLTKDELYDVLLQLVEYHSMLNARFSTDRDGTWTQRIIQSSSKSFKLLNPTFSSVEEAQSSFRSVQESLDIRDGPLLAASLMDVNEEQFLFVAVHHLVVDMVSWGILLDDLEALLIDKHLGPKPMSFQSWATAQNEYARRELTPTKVLASAVAITDSLSNYWGTRSQPDTYNTAERSQITLDAGTTALILGGANDALGTEPFEILLALILCSFGNVFTDRGLPVVFSEGHGRETWIDKADISRTVGWFTTMFPISISKPGHSSDLSLRVVQTLRLVKDYRRTLPGSGWPYFASRYLNEQGSASFAGHENMEILFNHLGSAGNRPRKRLLEAIAIGDASDVSPSATMAALFEITSVVQNGHLCIRFLWSPNVRHQSKIKLWTSEFENLASFAATMLAETPPMFTRADFPLLNLETNAAVDSVVHHCLTQLQMSDIAQIESIHPCSPMQEGILLSRSRTQGVYDVQGIWKVTTSMPQASVDLEKLRKACEQVVVLHDILRTYFAQGLDGDNAFLQIVMKEVSPPVQIVQLRSLDELQQLTPCHKSGLPYTFTICRITNGDVFFRLDINHALIDGTSTRLLLNDLSRAYAGRLPSTGATYRDFIAHLHSIPREEGLTFWTEMLKDTRPCHFPLLNEWAAGGPPTFRTVEIELTIGQSKQLNDFCKRHDTTLANFMSAIWALVLSCYVATDEERVTFGYLASGRDLPVAGAQSIMGPMITMIARQADIDPETTVLQLMQKMQQDFASSFPHQHVSLAEIHRALSLQSTPLFNTIVNMQRARVSVPSSDTELVWQAETGHDPSEVSLQLRTAFEIIYI
jgi:non-ribosomal peptide synthase protein (TIGR01720 family)